jgi:hypothetical protein
MLGLSLSALVVNCFAALVHPETASDAAPKPAAFRKSRRFKFAFIAKIPYSMLPFIISIIP